MMTLYDEQDIQNQHQWHARLQQERLNLSESVEATLADTTSQEQWDDDDQDSMDHSASNLALVPPRIRLQSKLLPAVRRGSFVQSATAEMAAQARRAEQKSQQTGILARIAHRLTSSIAAFGSSIQPEASPLLPVPNPYYDESQLPREHPRDLTPARSIMPIERPHTASATVIDAIPAVPSKSTAQPVQSKQRLAGHTAKIRLQTAPLPKTTVPPKEKLVREIREPRYEPLREPLIVNVRVREKVQEESLSKLPKQLDQSYQPSAATPEYPQKEPIKANITSAEIPSPAIMPAPSAANCKAFFGDDAFENGQADVMVKDAHVMAASVIHVTLTSNPGPTLVQYVSLHPEVGFTVHLTAPAVARTTFNYVLLNKD